MRVTVQYYAMLREQAGRNEESRETTAGTVGALYEELARVYRLTLPVGQLRAAINDQFVDWDAPLREGDRVIFIPPVAGG
ncbi:MAG: MoaD/ThiS family protein [Verrucomicrobiae bacterium]|nr:MoaD/ThiS family protein [Verrucomicrobiae bacterium]